MRDRFADRPHALRGEDRLGGDHRVGETIDRALHGRLIGAVAEHGRAAIRDVGRREAGREVQMHAGLGLDRLQRLVQLLRR